MANITAAQVKELRELTSAGMMECKKALTESNGDIQGAVEWLRRNGAAKAEKKAGRSTSEGRVGVLISDDGKKAAMVELLCETDFVARNEKFQELLNDLCKQTVAANSVFEGEMPSDMAGKVEAQVKEVVGVLGENMKAGRVCRFEVAEGEGRIRAYVHHDGKQAAMVEVACKSAAVAADAKFVELLDNLCKQVVAMDPKYVSSASVPEDIVKHELDGYVKAAIESGKPAEKAQMIAQGQVKKFLAGQCLLEQEYVLGDKETVADMVKAASKALGEELTVKRFYRVKI